MTASHDDMLCCVESNFEDSAVKLDAACLSTCLYMLDLYIMKGGVCMKLMMWLPSPAGALVL